MTRYVIPLKNLNPYPLELTGGKAQKISALMQSGFRVPAGCCVLSTAYEEYIQTKDLKRLINMELGRRPLEQMRWEELWDAAFRIRNAFLKNNLQEPLANEIAIAVRRLGVNACLAVRSSSVSEDAATSSFAGLHESFINVQGIEGVLDAVKMVWASLWSDAALLYRKELKLDPQQSRMAVVIQKMVIEDRSGIAFGADPRDLTRNYEILEAVEGSCAGLVSGSKDPDRWILERKSGEIIEWKKSTERLKEADRPLLRQAEIRELHQTMRKISKHFGWEPDVEWTGRGKNLTLLQVRPITQKKKSKDDEREWYLSLSLKPEELKKLHQKVTVQIIPALQQAGEQMSLEPLSEKNTCAELLNCIAERHSVLEHWRKVYKTDLIPFAHGVRAFGSFYNTLLKPEDPYEFVRLLSSSDFLSSKRNAAVQKLSRLLLASGSLVTDVKKLRSKKLSFNALKKTLRRHKGGKAFTDAFHQVITRFFDLAYKGERLSDDCSFIIHEILDLSRKTPSNTRLLKNSHTKTKLEVLENVYFKKAGRQERSYAAQILKIGRISWQLRDDDNLLLSRVESQYLRALKMGANKLKKDGRLQGGEVSEQDHGLIVKLLKMRRKKGRLPQRSNPKMTPKRSMPATQPRQLIGQPASPGLATGKVCVIQTMKDFNRFQNSDILVCDAIQPQITHLVPRASAIVERRGGMLIHGSIIARELGIPCVNGVERAAEILKNGDIVTVDGHLGIVSLGECDLELELKT